MLASKVTVSVAVFYKRDLSVADGDRTPMVPDGARRVSRTGLRCIGQRLRCGSILVDAPAKPLKPGTLDHAGRHDQRAECRSYSHFRWYRVVAADVVNGTRAKRHAGRCRLESRHHRHQAWLFENVIAVYEKNMRLELP